MTENKTKSTGSEIDWIDGDIPLARQFDDTYYARSDGLAESLHVFIKGNDLISRWPHMKQCLIAELGFGTGLNFLATLAQWRSVARDNAQLHFISFEQYPLDKEVIDKALGRWPQLNADAQRLLDNWETGFEFLDCEFEDNIRLTVFFANANTRLPQCEFAADAWFLDGFSPAKNPQLWNADLMRAVFERTSPGGTFATYTAAGWVRRNLVEAGFDVEKRTGFGTKREMLAGRRQSD